MWFRQIQGHEPKFKKCSPPPDHAHLVRDGCRRGQLFMTALALVLLLRPRDLVSDPGGGAGGCGSLGGTAGGVNGSRKGKRRSGGMRVVVTEAEQRRRGRGGGGGQRHPARRRRGTVDADALVLTQLVGTLVDWRVIGIRERWGRGTDHRRRKSYPMCEGGEERYGVWGRVDNTNTRAKGPNE